MSQEMSTGEKMFGWVLVLTVLGTGASLYQCACTPPATYEECKQEADEDLWRCREWSLHADRRCDHEWRQSKALCKEWLEEGDTE